MKWKIALIDFNFSFELFVNWEGDDYSAWSSIFILLSFLFSCNVVKTLISFFISQFIIKRDALFEIENTKIFTLSL